MTFRLNYVKFIGQFRFYYMVNYFFSFHESMLGFFNVIAGNNITCLLKSWFVHHRLTSSDKCGLQRLFQVNAGQCSPVLEGLKIKFSSFDYMFYLVALTLDEMSINKSLRYDRGQNIVDALSFQWK